MAHYAIEIPCPCSLVSSVLLDFPKYNEWCSFTPGAQRNDKSVLLSVQFPGEALRKQRVYLEEIGPRSLTWTYTLFSRCLLYARREQKVESLGDTTSRYTTSETMSGILAPVVLFLYGAKVKRGFQSVAEELRTRAVGVREETS